MHASRWPSTYVDLQQIGLEPGVVDWLELILALASYAGTVYAEAKVVEAFLYLMT